MTIVTGATIDRGGRMGGIHLSQCLCTLGGCRREGVGWVFCEMISEGNEDDDDDLLVLLLAGWERRANSDGEDEGLLDRARVVL